jgi:hypothetical protein
MIIQAWIIMCTGADRPYVSTHPPSPERKKALNEKGCKIYRADVLIPGWRVEDGVVQALAAEVEDESAG